MEFWRGLVLAAGTLTVVRVPVPGRVTPADLRASVAWYPLVGLAVGIVPALLLLLPLPPLVRAVAALAGWVVVTGALHLDGWTDCCDAAFAPARADAAATRQRRLEILRDPRIGTFGAAGLTLLLLGKWSALAHAPPAAALLAAPLARWAMVLALSIFPPARQDGLAAAFAGRVPLRAASLVLLPSLLPAFWLLPAGAALGAVLAGGAVAALTGAFLARRFGGVVGDVCGAVGEAAELAVLWALLPGSAR